MSREITPWTAGCAPGLPRTWYFRFFLFYRPPNPADLQAFPQNKEILRLELHKSSVGLKISATRWVVKLHLEPLVARPAYLEHDIFDFFYSTAPLTPLIYKPSPKTRKYCGLSFINHSVGLKISATRWVVKLHLEPLVAPWAYPEHDIFDYFLFYRPPNPADLQAFAPKQGNIAAWASYRPPNHTSLVGFINNL